MNGTGLRDVPPARPGWRDEARVLWQFARGKRSGSDHAADLDAFYGPQAQAYDAFRERLLPGRAEFMRGLPLRPGARVVDLGAGTGRHWLYVADALAGLARLDLVDLCEPLQAVARGRFATLPTVNVAHGDAQSWRAKTAADLVVFSYSLSMMRDWRAALDNALAQLAPGGVLAVIDFHSLPAAPPAPLTALPGFARWFWPRWFAHDGVMLREDVLPGLLEAGEVLALRQGRARLPYLPFSGAPWFLLVTRSRARESR